MAEPIIELELYLVRHGQSQSNAGLLDAADVRAFEDPFLTEKGLRQAELLGEFYARVDFDCILSSGMNRALQTAGEVAKRQLHARTVEAHPLFTENGVPERFGVKGFGEIRSAHPYAVPAAGTDAGGNFVIVQDHPPDEVRYARAQQALNYLRTRFTRGEKVMVVAHANFNTFFTFAALGLGPVQPFDVAFCNTGTAKYIFYKEGTGRWDVDSHMIYHNCMAHLAGEFGDDIVTAW